MPQISQEKRPSWLDIVTLSAALVVLTFGLGEYGLYEPHEGHFAGVAREMVLRGDWITPTLNGAPYLNKPPLLYWLGAVSIQLFGLSEFAARLPLAVSGWLGVVVAWKWARELWGLGAGRVVALMLSVTMGWFIFTHQLLIDALLSTLILATLYCLWRLVWEPKARYWVGLYGLLGLCLLAKGLLGLVFFCLGCAGLAACRRSTKIFSKLRPIAGGMITLAVTLPWFIAVEKANPGFLHYLLVNEHLKRIADTRWPPDYEVSTLSPLGYLVIAALWSFPWVLLLPQVITSAFADWRRGQQPSASIADKRRSEGVLLLMIAAITPIVLFLPLSSRLSYYSVPAIAPIVILCGGWWSRYHQNQRGRRAAGITFCLVGIGLSSGTLWLPSVLLGLPELAQTPRIGTILVSMMLSLGLGMLTGGVLLLRKQANLALIGLFVGLAAAWASLTYSFVVIQDFRSSEALIETANPRLGPTTLWTFEGSRELGAVGAMGYYLDSKGNPNPSEIPGRNQELSPGWAKGQQNIAYRTVLVLADGGVNRIPPQFPGPLPDYLITQGQLQTYWNSPRPVVFVTDFLRQSGQPSDPQSLNLPQDSGNRCLWLGQESSMVTLLQENFGLRGRALGLWSDPWRTIVVE